MTTQAKHATKPVASKPEHKPTPLQSEAPEPEAAPTEAPHAEKSTPTKIVVLEARKFLAGAGVVEVFVAQYLTDKHVIALCLANGVKFVDVSDTPTPTKILIRRTQTVPGPRGGSISVKSSEVVTDPWVIQACESNGACFDDVSDRA